MDNQSVISTLNGLIQTCKDGEEGFHTAGEGVADKQVKETFGKYSRQRGQMARELQDEVKGLGGDPATSGTVSASMHRGWINIKSVVTGKDDQAIIAEAERGVDVAKAAYAAALKTPLQHQVQALVQRQAAAVREAHDTVRAMEKRGAGAARA